MRLYNFPRSSASYRVRIACALKGLEVEEVLVNFRENEQRSDDYLSIAPAGLVPVLQSDEITLSQSMAIIRYLDRLVPEPKLIPEDPLHEARVLEMAYNIGCDIHPVNNLRVLNYLRENFQADDDAVNAWVKEWISLGFAALEQQINSSAMGATQPLQFCYGNSVTLADICLVPQVVNARRFDVPLDDFPSICTVDAHLRSLDEFSRTAP